VRSFAEVSYPRILLKSPSLLLILGDWEQAITQEEVGRKQNITRITKVASQRNLLFIPLSAGAFQSRFNA
jgi:hypothetical protein